MSEIIVLNTMPTVLTKDSTWEPDNTASPGAIIYLPEDAILVMPEETTLARL